MKRSSGPRKTANLSESTNRQLNKYALAAGAAGVGLLALVPPSEAKIIYTPAHIHIKVNGGLVELDLNHDGINDFQFSDYFYPGTPVRHPSYVPQFSSLNVAPDQQANRVVAARHSGYLWYCAAPLRKGVTVGPHNHFQRGGSNLPMINYQSGIPINCRWQPRLRPSAYFGLKFVVNGQIHFGWVRIKAAATGSGFPAIITGYAYETIAKKPIITGKTTGTDDVEKYDPGSGAFLTNPIPDTPQPASLGMLALGAQGVPLWRRKETQELIGQ